MLEWPLRRNRTRDVSWRWPLQSKPVVAFLLLFMQCENSACKRHSRGLRFFNVRGSINIFSIPHRTFCCCSTPVRLYPRPRTLRTCVPERADDGRERTALATLAAANNFTVGVQNLLLSRDSGSIFLATENALWSSWPKVSAAAAVAAVTRFSGRFMCRPATVRSGRVFVHRRRRRRYRAYNYNRPVDTDASTRAFRCDFWFIFL